MRVQAYTQYPVSVTITVCTPRSEPGASTVFYAASIHEDYCAKVGVALREYKHVGSDAQSWPASSRLQTYLPRFLGSPIYAFKQVMPGGVFRDVDAVWQLEVMRIRYEFVVNLLPGAFLGTDIECEAISRNVQSAIKGLFDALSIPSVYIPGAAAADIRLGDRSDIDIIAEVGPASARGAVEIPPPAA